MKRYLFCKRRHLHLKNMCRVLLFLLMERVPLRTHYSDEEIKEFAGHRDEFLDEIKDNMELDSSNREICIKTTESQAESNLAGNTELLEEACTELETEIPESSADRDSIIRKYLLPEAIENAVSGLEESMGIDLRENNAQKEYSKGE